MKERGDFNSLPAERLGRRAESGLSREQEITDYQLEHVAAAMIDFRKELDFDDELASLYRTP